MPDLEVRDLSLDDRDATLELRSRSFGPMPADGLAWFDPIFAKTVAARRAVGVFHGGLLVAAARLHAYRQLWRGRPVPMSGVAGVYVAPEWRGRQVATLLLTHVLGRSHQLGDAIAVLFPSVVPPYRRLGFEVAGTVSKTTFRADTLRGLGPCSAAVRRATPADAQVIAPRLRQYDERVSASGPLDLDENDVGELLSDTANFCYLAEGGVILYAWDGGDLRVERMAGDSVDTLRALWALAGSGSSIVRDVYTYQPLHDPVRWILDAKAHKAVEQESWMLRVVDASKAISLRGFPVGPPIEVALLLEDRWLPGSAGRFRLRVSDGTGVLDVDDGPAGDATALGPNGLAALYAGTPVSTLRLAGLISGGTEHDDALLDAAFAARPYLLDTF
jgi:predicted acetyltransferase